MAVSDRNVKAVELLSSFVRQESEEKEGNYSQDRSSKNGVNDQQISRPRHRQSFLERVHTYTSSRWFAKPAWLSPLVCARYGWENVDVDVLRCVSCKAHISGRMPAAHNPKAYDECCQRLKSSLQSGHNRVCPWSYSQSPEYFLRLPYDTRPKADHAFRLHMEKLLRLGEQLPLLPESFLETKGLSLAQLRQVLLSYTAVTGSSPPAVAESAGILALTGWSTNSASCTAMVHCSLCNRHVGMWNYLTLANPNVETVVTEVVESVELPASPKSDSSENSTDVGKDCNGESFKKIESLESGESETDIFATAEATDKEMTQRKSSPSPNKPTEGECTSDVQLNRTFDDAQTENEKTAITESTESSDTESESKKVAVKSETIDQSTKQSNSEDELVHEADKKENDEDIKTKDKETADDEKAEVLTAGNSAIAKEENESESGISKVEMIAVTEAEKDTDTATKKEKVESRIDKIAVELTERKFSNDVKSEATLKSSESGSENFTKLSEDSDTGNESESPLEKNTKDLNVRHKAESKSEKGLFIASETNTGQISEEVQDEGAMQSEVISQSRIEENMETDEEKTLSDENGTRDGVCTESLNTLGQSEVETDNQEPPVKRQKTNSEVESVRKKHTRETTLFDPVTDHHDWCPWVSAGSSDGTEPGWHQMLYLLLPNLSPEKRNSIPRRDVSSSPEVLRSIRRLFNEWTSPAVIR